MRSKVLVPILVAGLALSGNAFGQTWTRSTATNVNSGTSKANTYNPNTPNAKAGFQEQLLLRMSPEVNNFGSNPTGVPKGD
jgi:hypothetical protein